MDAIAELGRDALLLAVKLSLPVAGAAAVSGALTALVQNVSQVHDPSVSHLPRLIAVTAVLITMGPWMGTEIVTFARQIWAIV